MGFEFDYMIKGRKVTKEQWLRHIAEEAKTTTIEDLKQRVTRLRCRVHGRSPRVVRTTRTGDNVRFEIEACCPDMRDRAEQVAIGH
jgi:hypothetical protein